MANASDVSVGLAHEVVIRLTAAGAEVEDIAKLSRDETLCGQVVQLARGEVEVVVAKLLARVGTVKIPAAKSKFVAKDKFVVNTSDDAAVKISGFGSNFTAWYLSGDGKTEDPTGETTLRYAKLRKSSVDGPIIAELGGVEGSETTLSEMFALMKKQGKGEDGVLLNNGYANIFYIKDQTGTLRTVAVLWRDVGWIVHALSVEDPYGWSGGCQVFSRDS